MKVTLQPVGFKIATDQIAVHILSPRPPDGGRPATPTAPCSLPSEIAAVTAEKKHRVIFGE